MKRLIFFLCLICLCFSCSEKEDAYPSIVSEFADIFSDNRGAFIKFATDDDKTYLIQNKVTGYQPNAFYRGVCGFVPDGTSATLYQLDAVYILRDSTSRVCHDPINVTSIWRAGKYINMQLTPKTRGNGHFWGYCTDSTRVGHIFLSLHHNQNKDPLAYSETVYASLPVDSLKGVGLGDSITLSICTFDGIIRQYKFTK